MRTGIIFSTFCFIVLTAGLLSGCYYDKEDLLYHKTAAVDCTTINAKFSANVQPIIKNKCATSGCHNAASSAGGAVLETYTQISGLSARINQRCIIDKTMPPGGALTPDEISILSCWIGSGSLNN